MCRRGGRDGRNETTRIHVLVGTGPGWLLFIYLVVAQGVTAIDYDLGVAMGTQESVEVITEVGAAFWYGFAVGDLLLYIPVFAYGAWGLALAVRDTHEHP